MTDPPDSSLLTRYALLPAACVALLTGLLLAFAHWLVIDELTRHGLADLDGRTALLARWIDQDLRDAQRLVQIESRSSTLARPWSIDKIRNELEYLRQGHPDFVWLGLIDLNGRVVAGTRHWLEGESILTRPMFERGLHGSFVGDVHQAVALARLLQTGGGVPQELLDFGEPVRDADGHVVGVLAGHVGVDGIRRRSEAALNANMAVGDGMADVVAYVLSGPSARSVLPGPGPAEGIPLVPMSPAIVKANDGEHYFAATRPVVNEAQAPLLPWRVMTLQPVSSALASAHRVMRMAYGLGLAAALLAGWLGFLYARRVLRPLHLIVHQLAQRAAQGGHAALGDKDIGELARGSLLQDGIAPTSTESLLLHLARGVSQLKRLVDRLPVGVAVIDRNFRVEFVNAGYTRLLGWTTDQVKGRVAAEFLHDAADRAEFVRIYSQMGNPPGAVCARFDALTPDGQRVSVQWDLVPLYGEDGQFEGALAMMRDIRAERAARARADALAGRLRALADAAVDDLIATLDLDGRVLEWNRGAHRLTGWSSSEVEGRTVAELFAAFGEPANYLRAAARDGSCAASLRLERPDGRVVWLQGSFYALGLAPGSARFGVVLHDVTEQRLTVEALEQSQARLRVALKAARMGTWEVQYRDGEPFADWSADYGEILGIGATSSPQPAGRLNSMVHDDDWPRLRGALVDSLKHGVPLSAEFRLRRGGEWRWHALFGQAQRGPDGRATRMVGVGMDVSERRVADQKLRESQELLQRVVQTMGEGLVMLDAEGRFTLVNPAVSRITGASSEELMGHRYDDVPFRRLHESGGLASEHLPSEHAFMRLRRGEPRIRDEIKVIERPDGGRRITTQNAMPLHDAQGRFAGAVLSYVDITERYLAERDLIDSQARLAAIVDSASDAIISIDERCVVTLANPAASRIFGLPAGRIVDQPLEQLLVDSDRSPHAQLVAGFAASGVSRRPMGRGIVRGRHADGRVLSLEASISQTVVRGETVLTAILRDVTEIIAQQEALQAAGVELADLAQRLLAQEKETTRHLAQALHDELGQTLTALRLHWEALSSMPEEKSQELKDRISALVLTANGQIRHVLNELRPPLLDEFGLVAALDNEMSRQPVPVGAPALALDAPARLQHQRWPSDVEYAGFMVAREALLNALVHAKASRIEAEVLGDAGELLMRVSDDGVGVPASSRGGRTGHLGLVGMRERALSIGATLDIGDRPGGGTVVTLHWNLPDEQDLPDR